MRSRQTCMNGAPGMLKATALPRPSGAATSCLGGGSTGFNLRGRRGLGCGDGNSALLVILRLTVSLSTAGPAVIGNRRTLTGPRA